MKNCHHAFSSFFVVLLIVTLFPFSEFSILISTPFPFQRFPIFTLTCFPCSDFFTLISMSFPEYSIFLSFSLSSSFAEFFILNSSFFIKMTNSVHFPSSLSARMVPPCARTTWCTKLRPSPTAAFGGGTLVFVEDGAQVAAGDAAAVVADAQLGVASLGAGADVYLHGLGVRAGIFDSVVQQVLHHLGPILGIGVDVGHLQVVADAQGLGASGREAYGQFLHHGTERQGFGIHAQAVVLQLGEGQHFVGQRQQVTGLERGVFMSCTIA